MIHIGRTVKNSTSTETMFLRTHSSSFGTAAYRSRDLCFHGTRNHLHCQIDSATISSIAISVGRRSVYYGISNSFCRPIYRRKLFVQNHQLPKASSAFSSSSSSSWMPAAGSITIWGGCGWLITTLHMGGTIPYWVCMSLSSLVVRTCLLPLVVQGAHTQVKFASIAPDIQFLLTLFQQDRQMMKMDQRTQTNPAEMNLLKRQHFQASWRNLRYIYKSNNVHPLDIFKAPLLQIPFFFYFASDLQRIIRGTDPSQLELARALQDGGTLWFVDLTEPDPFFVLPVITGSLMYINVELATGRHSLSGTTTSKANFVKAMKDFFQSLSIFLPCFMSNSPAGVQIYLVTTFLFTLSQSAALRNDVIRRAVGLPSLGGVKPQEPVFAAKFKQFAEEQQGQQPIGENVLGSGVLRPAALHTASTGSKRPSSIIVKEVTEIPLASNDDAAMEAANIGDQKNFIVHRQRPKTVLVTETNKEVKTRDKPTLSLKKLLNKNKRKS